MKLLDKFIIEEYNIGIIRKNASDIISNGIDKNDITWLKHKFKDRLFADPFVIDEDEKNIYILVEELIFWHGKGRIVLLTVNKEDFSLVDRKLIIEEDVHLSFPFCEFKGDYIIPESCHARKTRKYIYDKEKKEVVSKSVIIEKGLVDTCFYKMDGKNYYAFASTSDHCNEKLFVYKEKDGMYYPLDSNPMDNDIKRTRAAGGFFKIDEKLYRTVQDCEFRYGKQVRILEITDFDENKLKYKDVQTITSDLNPPYNDTMHTLNFYDGYAICDGSKDKVRFPARFFYKYTPFLFRGREK